MKKILSIPALAITLLAGTNLLTNSVVKIYSSISVQDYQHPWQSGKLFNISGSGVVLDNSTILTSAHMVSNAKFIQISKDGSSKKYTAKLEFMSNQADLALLKVSDKSFFKGIKPLRFTNDITQAQSITVLGYPKGGKSLSATKGVVSRIEFNSYVWSNKKMLSIQIDAPVNSGNSGGVALNKNREIVGIVMQMLNNSNNIAYIVPSLIVNTFLQDIKDGKVDGYDDSTNIVQKLENQTLKEYYGIKNDKGVIVIELNKDEKELKLGDIILSVGSHEVLNDATIKTPYGYLNYKYALHVKPVGSKIEMKIIRDKKIITINYLLKREQTVLKYEHNTKPRYLIYGGLVFAPLTYNYTYKLKLSSSLSFLFFHNCKTKYIKEAVIVQYEKFPNEVNSGYTPKAEIVKAVNGTRVVDFAHFVKLIDAVNTPLTTIEFIDNKKKIILDTKRAKESFKDIKSIYELGSDRRL